MNNPENSSFQLNFLQLFHKSTGNDLFMKSSSMTTRSEQIYPPSKFSQRTTNFIPKYPYGRSSSVNSQRKNLNKQLEQQNFGIFSIRTLESRTPRFVNKSMVEKKTQNSPIRIKLLNQRINLLKVKEQLTKNSANDFQSKMKIKGLKVRMGSEAKKNKQKIQFDHSVIVKGKKLQII